MNTLNEAEWKPGIKAVEIKSTLLYLQQDGVRPVISRRDPISQHERSGRKTEGINEDYRWWCLFPTKVVAKRHEVNFLEDEETFKLVLFLMGNGCSPDLIRRWIAVLAQYWATSWQRAEKRARQVDYELNNVDQKRNSWFFFDIDCNRQLYLNGLPKRS